MIYYGYTDTQRHGHSQPGTHATLSDSGAAHAANNWQTPSTATSFSVTIGNSAATARMASASDATFNATGDSHQSTSTPAQGQESAVLTVGNAKDPAYMHQAAGGPSGGTEPDLDEVARKSVSRMLVQLWLTKYQSKQGKLVTPKEVAVDMLNGTIARLLLHHISAKLKRCLSMMPEMQQYTFSPQQMTRIVGHATTLLENRGTFLVLAHGAASGPSPSNTDKNRLERLRQAYYEAYTMLMSGAAPDSTWPKSAPIQQSEALDAQETKASTKPLPQQQSQLQESTQAQTQAQQTETTTSSKSTNLTTTTAAAASAQSQAPIYGQDVANKQTAASIAEATTAQTSAPLSQASKCEKTDDVLSLQTNGNTVETSGLYVAGGSQEPMTTTATDGEVRAPTPEHTSEIAAPAVRLVDAYLNQIEQKHIAYLIRKVPLHLRPGLLDPFLKKE
ncbi:hypothetical protein THASP1DRAFT_29698 [Thamnocephalis sphaerospora]|uniref:Uncharacterized protein n=1 Tax=Thamnocephalis sphaerospora TaxID=78915 RepID=A0A4P9XR09_9FUNG|nr:hypothetical protein THASP1DRAFT_29698 [Thamnocephalis sphaerospora]|eukprot:RKP08496.1 hypothetical protein THASP1DRAFT_29698 [Thamnocephalis sphaerospora]